MLAASWEPHINGFTQSKVAIYDQETKADQFPRHSLVVAESKYTTYILSNAVQIEIFEALTGIWSSLSKVRYIIEGLQSHLERGRNLV